MGKKIKKMEEKINVIGKNALYIKEVVDKLATKNEVGMDELDVDNMDFEINTDDLDLDLDSLELDSIE